MGGSATRCAAAGTWPATWGQLAQGKGSRAGLGGQTGRQEGRFPAPAALRSRTPRGWLQVPHPQVHCAGHPGGYVDLQVEPQRAASLAGNGHKVGSRDVLGGVHPDACDGGQRSCTSKSASMAGMAVPRCSPGAGGHASILGHGTSPGMGSACPSHSDLPGCAGRQPAVAARRGCQWPGLQPRGRRRCR